MSIAFSKESDAQLERLLKTYPNAEACLIPALHLAQAQFGYVSHEVMEMVAARLGLPPQKVLSTSTFYTMFNKQPVGRFHVQVCANVSCYLRGSDSILKALEEELGIAAGQTTPDKAFTLTTVQCLAACGTAPAMQVNDTYYENLTPDAARDVVRRLRKGDAR
jgi:NADH-quinone oxidoreductase E subunit